MRNNHQPAASRDGQGGCNLRVYLLVSEGCDEQDSVPAYVFDQWVWRFLCVVTAMPRFFAAQNEVCTIRYGPTSILALLPSLGPSPFGHFMVGALLFGSFLSGHFSVGPASRRECPSSSWAFRCRLQITSFGTPFQLNRDNFHPCGCVILFSSGSFFLRAVICCLTPE